MRLNIDIEKSIEKRRLIPTSWYFKTLDYFIYSFFAIAFIICIIGPTIGKEIKIDLTDIVFITLVLFVFTIVIFALNKMDRLEVIEIHYLEPDHNFFISMKKENKWLLLKESDNVFLFDATERFLHERQVTIIKSSNLIFVNVMSFGSHGIKSPIYMRKDREILTGIIEKIKNNAT